MARSQPTQTRLVRIGNSRGVRIPKPLIAQAGLSERVSLDVQNHAVIIRSSAHAREGWAQAFASMAKRGDDALLDRDRPTRFEHAEWQW